MRYLEQGWSLIQQGKIKDAETQANRAHTLNPKAPEVHNLLGFVAALSGRPEQAIQHYQIALVLNNKYFEAMLNAAEVLVHPLGLTNEALQMCEQALLHTKTEEEIADVLLIKIEALLHQQNEKAAREVLRMMPDGPFQNALHDFRIGRAYFELEDFQHAAEWIDRALKRDDRNVEAHYYRGLIYDAQDDGLNAIESFLRVRILDGEHSDLSWSTDPEDFEKSVIKAIGTLDIALRKFVNSAKIFITPLPGLEIVAEGVDPRTMIYLDAIATPELPGPPCSRMFVYQRNVERSAREPAQIIDELVSALEHEITTTFLESPLLEALGERIKAKHELN